MPSSSARAAAKRKAQEGYRERNQRAQLPVTQEERVRWALTRVRAAKFKANMHKGDRVLALAVLARQAEYDRERRALEAIERRATA